MSATVEQIRIASIVTDQINFKLYDSVWSDPGREYKLGYHFMRNIRDCGNNEHDVFIGFRIVPDEESADKTLPFALEVIIRGRFQIGASIADKEAILKANCTAMLFPYLRTAVSGILSISGLDSIILPVMDVTQLFSAGETTNEDGAEGLQDER